jgi:hypothetical protein
LNIAEKFELSRQKRQTGIIPINTGFDGKNLARIQVTQVTVKIVFDTLCSEKKSSISSAFRTVHCRIFGKIPHDFSRSPDTLRSSVGIARTVSQ